MSGLILAASVVGLKGASGEAKVCEREDKAVSNLPTEALMKSAKACSSGAGLEVLEPSVCIGLEYVDGGWRLRKATLHFIYANGPLVTI